MPARSTTLEPVIQGEAIESWVLTWDDADGVDFALGGFTGTASWRVNGGTTVTRAVTVGPSTTTLTWTSADHAVAGVLTGEVQVTAGAVGPYMHGFQRVILPRRGS